VSDVENESHVDICTREGILFVFSVISPHYRPKTTLFRFIVYPRPRATRRDQAAFKIKSVLKGTEYDGEAI
jgi:translation initiation factor 2-alpha kinase 4